MTRSSSRSCFPRFSSGCVPAGRAAGSKSVRESSKRIFMIDFKGTLPESRVKIDINSRICKITAPRLQDCKKRRGSDPKTAASSGWSSKLSLHKKLSTFCIWFPELVDSHIIQRFVASDFIIPDFYILEDFEFDLIGGGNILFPYISSHLRLLKKLSATALSQQFPRRGIP